MQIDTSSSLFDALRSCGLFAPDQLETMLRELGALGDDTQALTRHILHREWLSLYQLRKVLRGKSAELHLGPYVLVEKVAEGGMGKVYRGRRVSDGSPFALKIVRPILLANPLIRKRYEREVATALSLKHPNIVAVFDAGEVDGRFYLAMEFVDGIDLSRLVKEFRPLEVSEACEYAQQAALGLHHAHEAGFVHRDIKPSNVVVAGERHVTGATEPAVVKILDMGLIRAVGFDEDGPPSVDLTRDGTVVGTPDYMSPEQAKNSSAVDHRADLYSLGCTLYFLLAGRPPFPDGNAIEKIIKHQLEAPLPLQALRPDVPTPVAEIVARLMAKAPGDRFPTAWAAADALEAAGRSIGSKPAAQAPGNEKDGAPGSRAAPDQAFTATKPVSHPQAATDETPRSGVLPTEVRTQFDTYPVESLSEMVPESNSKVVRNPRRYVPAASRSRNGNGTRIAIAIVLVLVFTVSVWALLSQLVR